MADQRLNESLRAEHEQAKDDSKKFTSLEPFVFTKEEFTDDRITGYASNHLGGTKLDTQKCQLELLSSPWIFGVGDVLTFGAKKYAAHNWRKGITISRLLGACLRHIFAFLSGQDKDPETKLNELLHASCCLMFAYELYITKPQDVDDRYKIKNTESIPVQEEIAREVARMKEKMRG